MKQKVSELGLKVASQNSRYAVCHCPFHNDKNASALVYLDNFWFVCFVCHINKPLEVALKDAGLEGFTLEDRPENFDLDLFDNQVKVQPLTGEATRYLEERGISEMIPSFVASPVNNLGVAFCFTNNQGNLVGTQTRLFPENVPNKSSRYIFEGTRLPFFGDYKTYLQKRTKLFVFEKAFATLKADIAARKFGIPITAISAVGSHFRSSLLDFTNINTTFFFDDDEAGRNAAKAVKKKTGARVLIPSKPLDEISIDEMGSYLRKFV